MARIRRMSFKPALRASSLLFTLALFACAPEPSPRAPLPPQPVAVHATQPAAVHAAQSSAAPATAPAVSSPPVARRVPHPQALFGRNLDDDYFWLRQKDTPEVVAYLNAENAYTDAATKPLAPLRDALYKEMLSRIQETDATVPYRKDGWFYYNRTVEGQQYPIFCRKSAAGAAPDDLVGATTKAPEEVLLDLNELGKKEKFVGLGAFDVSDDGRTLAYTLDTTGFRQFNLRFKNLQSGAASPESIPRVTSVAWAKDGKTVFYVTEDATTKRSNQLHRHVVGDDPAKDALVYEEKDELFDLGVGRTRSRGFVIVQSESKTTSEVRLIDAAKPLAAPRVIEPRQHDHRYYVDHRGNEFFIRTDSPAKAGGPRSPNFRIVTAPVATPGRAHWKELIAHQPDVLIEDFELFAHQLVLVEHADALPRLRVIVDRGAPQLIPMPEAIYATFPDHNPEFDPPAYRFHYQSPITPDSVFDYDWKSHALALRKRIEVKGGYDPSAYEVARVSATAADGTKIPISVMYRKSVKPDGKTPRPFFLYGYGSYGISIPLIFNSNVVSLLDRGVVYGVAHIRGGGDMGKPWHEAGRMAHKMNTFTDFIACGEELIKRGWTARDRLAIMGGSAGGLLMGAVTNLRPDLWKAVVAQVPFVDVINTMLDESLPLTVGEFEEWGNPKKKDDFEAMIQYSPYDNVAKKDYPAMLVATSYNDSQVMYWEPAKYVARLRALKTDHNPLYLKINMEPAGHGGQSGRYNQLRERAFIFAWVLDELGIHQ